MKVLLSGVVGCIGPEGAKENRAVFLGSVEEGVEEVAGAENENGLEGAGLSAKASSTIFVTSAEGFFGVSDGFAGAAAGN